MFKTGRYVLSEKSFINAMGRSQGLDQKDLQDHLYINIVVSPDPFSLTPSPSSAVNAPQNTEEMEISKRDSCITCTARVYKQKQKITCKI